MRDLIYMQMCTFFIDEFFSLLSSSEVYVSMGLLDVTQSSVPVVLLNDQILLCGYHMIYSTRTVVVMVRKRHLTLAICYQQAQNAETPSETPSALPSGCVLVMRHCGSTTHDAKEYDLLKSV